MLQRIIALTLAAFFIGLVVLMASVTLFVRDPLPILSPRVPASFDHAAGGSTLTAQVSVDGAFRFAVRIASNAATDAPEVILRNPATGGAPLAPDVEVLPDGTYQASGQFTAPGRWQVSLRHGTHTPEFAFILRE